MRKYALVVFDNLEKIIARFNLDLVTDPSGNGFALSLDKIQGNVEDVLTKVVQKKLSINMTVNQYRNPYEKSGVLSAWIEKYSKPNNIMCLEYDDGVVKKYCEGRVTKLDKTELDMFGVLSQSLEFTPLTPMFIKQDRKLIITPTSIGKKYPFKYAYTYGASLIENNTLDNYYLQEVPLVVIIHGTIRNPKVVLTDEEGNVYSSVGFTSSLNKDEQIIINSAQRKIIKQKFDVNGNIISTSDYVPYVDPTGDTFLRAKEGKTTISINLQDTDEGFFMEGSWRQYTL